MVKVLLAGGAKVDSVVQGGFTALHIAAESGNQEMVQLLLKVRRSCNDKCFGLQQAERDISLAGLLGMRKLLQESSKMGLE